MTYKPEKDTGEELVESSASKNEEAKERDKATATKETKILNSETGKLYTHEKTTKIKKQIQVTKLDGVIEDYKKEYTDISKK